MTDAHGMAAVSLTPLKDSLALDLGGNCVLGTGGCNPDYSYIASLRVQLHCLEFQEGSHAADKLALCTAAVSMSYFFGGKASVEPAIFGKGQHDSRPPHQETS